MPSKDPEPLSFDSIESCIQAFRNGQFIIVLDSTARENEGDLIIAAEDMTPEKMAFMVRFSSGIICTPLPSSLASSLSLPLMVPPSSNSDPNGTAYTVSIDGSHPSITTGISASDRSLTCNLLANPSSTSRSFRRPGHIFPLIARDGGIRQRRGHTEAAVEFCHLAGKRPVGVISEIVEEMEVLLPPAHTTTTTTNTAVALASTLPPTPPTLPLSSASPSSSSSPSGEPDTTTTTSVNETATTHPIPQDMSSETMSPSASTSTAAATSASPSPSASLFISGGTSMLRRDGCLRFAKKWGLKCCTVEDLVEYVERRHSTSAVGNGINGNGKI